MAFAASSLPFDRLNEGNYVTWAFNMECFLVREDLWKIIETPPTVGNAVEECMDKRAKATIGLSVENSQLI